MWPFKKKMPATALGVMIAGNIYGGLKICDGRIHHDLLDQMGLYEGTDYSPLTQTNLTAGNKVIGQYKWHASWLAIILALYRISAEPALYQRLEEGARAWTASKYRLGGAELSQFMQLFHDIQRDIDVLTRSHSWQPMPGGTIGDGDVRVLTAIASMASEFALKDNILTRELIWHIKDGAKPFLFKQFSECYRQVFATIAGYRVTLI